MSSTIIFLNRFNHTTVFTQTESAIALTQLWNLECGWDGQDSGPENTRGLCVLETADGPYEDNDFRLSEFHHDEDRLNICWQVGDSGLLWRSHWQVEPKTGIWNRKDWLENAGQESLEVRRCLARIPLSPGKYEIYTQASNWARENQGHWNEFFGGRVTLRSQSGRTTQIANPYLFIRETGADHGIAFHILPRGNWTIQVDRTSTTRDELAPSNILELGLSDHALSLPLLPGKIMELPEILIQDVPSNHPETGSAALHLYLLDKYFTNHKIAPVVYNTWFDRFDSLQTERLAAQLAIAKEIGCEVFTVDAGWYGVGEGNWHSLVGDWREKLDGAFHGDVSAFADEVRASGLGFGLWIEPERNHADGPVVKAHPEWFRAGLGGFFYPDLSQLEAYHYIRAELSRLIETYQLVWMKIDFNFDLGYCRDQFYGYFQHWYQLLDELREKYPNTFFEGCASGGMRLDLNTLTHFDGHFLSDNVNPIDILRISQGAMLRLPPGRITKWAVLRSHGDQTLTPGGGDWDKAIRADVDFVCRTALPGMFGISGDLTGLPEETRTRLRRHVDLFKKWRELIHGAAAYLLSPIQSIDDRSGWVAFQLKNPTAPATTLVFVYRLSDGRSHKIFHLRDLDTTKTYTVTDIDTPKSPQHISGLDLLTFGLKVALPHPFGAAIFKVQLQD